DCVKVYSNLNRPSLEAIRAAAAERGLPVVGHVPSWVAFEDAHIADVQHLTGVPLPAPPWEWPNPSFRDFLSPWAAAWLRLTDARLDAVVQTSLEQGIRHT